MKFWAGFAGPFETIEEAVEYAVVAHLPMVDDGRDAVWMEF